VTDVRVTLMLFRGEEVLFEQPPTAQAGEAAPFTIPSTALVEGESLAAAAARLAAAAGFDAVEGLVVQHTLLAPAADGTEVRLSLAARVPAEAEPAPGFFFHAAGTPPAPLDELADRAFDACRRGARVTDLDGVPVPLEVMPSPPAAQAPGDLDAGEKPVAAAPRPGLLAAGFWFGGALLWVSSVLLVFDQLRVFGNGGGSGAILWVHGAAFSLYGCARAGMTFETGREAAARALAVLGIGAAVLLVAALFVGTLAPAARVAYVMLGFVGIPTFFLAQRLARRRMPSLTPRARRILTVVQVLAVLLSFAVYLMR
jgi:hypothetical protein